MTRTERDKLRAAIADYIASEGCSCCRGQDHDEHKDRLAKLLEVKPDKDGYYSFWPFRNSANGGAPRDV